MSRRDQKYESTLKCAYTYLLQMGTKVMVQDNAAAYRQTVICILGQWCSERREQYAFESNGTLEEGYKTATLSPYYATDHLGSVRVWQPTQGNSLLERNDYFRIWKEDDNGGTYPVNDLKRWKYNGKEVQTTWGTNWLIVEKEGSNQDEEKWDRIIRFVKPDAWLPQERVLYLLSL